jgi:MoxR-like ATPase
MLPEKSNLQLDDLKSQPEFSVDNLFDWEKYFHFLPDEAKKFLLPKKLCLQLDNLKKHPEFSLDSLFDWEKHFHFLPEKGDKFWYGRHKFDEYLHIAFQGGLPDELLFSRTVACKTEPSNQELLGDWLRGKRKSIYLELKHQDLKTKKSKTIFYYKINGNNKFKKLSNSFDIIFNEYLQKRKQKICIIISGINNKPKRPQYERSIILVLANCFLNYLSSVDHKEFEIFIHIESPDDSSEEYSILKRIREQFVVTLLMHFRDSDKRFTALGDLVNKTFTQNYAFIKELYNIVDHIKNFEEPILLLGEKGTAKSTIARTIHELRGLPKKTLVDKSFAEISEGELTGWEKGAFTGANRKQVGLLENCNNGTLFLDEIDRSTKMDRNIILRFIETKEYSKRGSAGKIEKSNTKLIFGTNKNLKDYIKNGLFEADFYDRIKQIQITLPPLRKRKEDIPLLVKSILSKFNNDNKSNIKIDFKVYEYLNKFAWPDNIRGLEKYLRSVLQKLHSREKELLTEKFLVQNPPEITDEVEAHTINELETVLDKIMASYEINSEISLSEEYIYPIVSKVYLDHITARLGKTKSDELAFKIIGIGADPRNDKNIYKYLKKYQEIMKEFEKPLDS